jgi:hypothetical protein
VAGVAEMSMQAGLGEPLSRPAGARIVAGGEVGGVALGLEHGLDFAADLLGRTSLDAILGGIADVPRRARPRTATAMAPASTDVRILDEQAVGHRRRHTRGLWITEPFGTRHRVELGVPLSLIETFIVAVEGGGSVVLQRAASSPT